MQAGALQAGTGSQASPLMGSEPSAAGPLEGPSQSQPATAADLEDDKGDENQRAAPVNILDDDWDELPAPSQQGRAAVASSSTIVLVSTAAKGSKRKHRAAKELRDSKRSCIRASDIVKIV
jgi:hypothetical protein